MTVKVLSLDKKQYYSLRELCQLEGVTERTVRYYIQEGLLPPPSGAGIFSRYGYEHRLRLQFIKRLKDEFLPLSEIKNLLANRSVADLEALANSPRAGGPTGETNPEPRLEDWLGQGESLRKKLSEQTQQYASRPLPPPVSTGKISPEPPTAKPLVAPVPPPVGYYRTDKKKGAYQESKPAPMPPKMQAGGFGAVPPPSASASMSSPAPGSPPMPAPARQEFSLGMARSVSPYYGNVEVSSVNEDIEPVAYRAEMAYEALLNAAAEEALPFEAQTEEIKAQEMPQLAPEPTGLGQSWEKVNLAPGVELHVESSVAQTRRSDLEKVIKAAKELLE